MTTDTSERGLERLVVSQMTGLPLDEVIARETGSTDAVREDASQFIGPTWRLGSPADFDRRFCLDLHQLAAFLKDTQPEIADAVSIDAETPTRVAFLQRLSSELVVSWTSCAAASSTTATARSTFTTAPPVPGTRPPPRSTAPTVLSSPGS